MMNKIRWGWIVGIPVLLVGFQNCGDFVLDQNVMENASLSNAQSLLDSEAYSTLTDPTKSELVRWYQQGATNKVDEPYAGTDKLSYVVALDKAMTGKVFAANSSADSVEETSISIASGKIRVSRIASAGNLYYGEVGLPSSGSKMVIAIRSGAKAEDFDFLVNGVKQTFTKVKTGAPQEFSFVVKSIVTGSTGGKVYEYMVYADRLSLAQLNSMSRFVGENNGINEVIFDPSVLNDTSDGTTTGPDTKLLAAKAVIDAKCLSCHSSELSNMTAAKMVNSGWVKAGDPLKSKLYTSLKGSQGSGMQSMPKDGSTLTAAQVQAVYDWIAAIK